MIGFIAWQTAFGFWVVGYIMGFGSSIALAAFIVWRERRKYYESELNQREEAKPLPRTRH